MEQAEESQFHAFERKFGYSEIQWEIENFLSATCEKNWVIQSPDFSVRGYQITKWRFLLKSRYIEESCIVETYLERLESDPFPGAVRVKWKLGYSSGEVEHVVTEATGIFERKTSVKSDILNIGKLLENNMRYISCDTFLVRCRMIVYNKDSTRYDISDDLGLKSLSQDMAVLFRLEKKSDVTLFIGKTILAHKAILCVRNSVLSFEIEKHGDSIEIDFVWVQPEAAANLIAFFYTGNLDYILRTPSLSLPYLINYLNVTELKSYFVKDELAIRTSIDMQEFSFQWLIPNASLTKDCLFSPFWRMGMLNTAFQLRLQLKSTDKDTDHVSIYGQFVLGVEPKEVYMECAIVDEIDKPRRFKRLSWTSKESKILGFETFLTRDILNNPKYLIQGHLGIICRLQIPTGTQRHCVISSKVCSVRRCKRDYHYEKLSDDLGTLFETGKYSDFSITSRVICYKVHTNILSTRSHVFAKIIKDLKDEKSLSLPDVDPHTLRIVLQYIYSGTLKNHNLDDIKRIYAAAEKFCILPLKYTCSRILQDTIQLQNVLEILTLANKGKDFKLKFSAFKFICCNISDVQTQANWYAFVDANPSLSKEFIDFVKKFIFLRHREDMEKSGNVTIDDFIKNFKF